MRLRETESLDGMVWKWQEFGTYDSQLREVVVERING